MQCITQCISCSLSRNIFGKVFKTKIISCRNLRRPFRFQQRKCSECFVTITTTITRNDRSSDKINILCTLLLSLICKVIVIIVLSSVEPTLKIPRKNLRGGQTKTPDLDIIYASANANLTLNFKSRISGRHLAKLTLMSGFTF